MLTSDVFIERAQSIQQVGILVVRQYFYPWI